MLYEQVAQTLRQRIRDGIYPSGARLPGLREIARQSSVSLSTAVAAVRLLEDEGWVEGRERSGFFVLDIRGNGTSGSSAPDPGPATVTGQSLTLSLLRASSSARFGQLGVAMPHHSFLPIQPLQRAFRQAARWRSGRAVEYAFPPGVPELRQQVARRLSRAGCSAPPERVIITSGAQEALNLSLRVLTAPGDLIAVESPTYYGLLQCIEALELKVIEVPTHPDRGISVAALRLALEQWPVKACVLVPNHGNPVGYAMPDARKQALAALLDERGVALIEDDVYGDLGYCQGRPRTVQSFMRNGHWFLAGSASKTISAGLRLGWLVAPAPLQERINHLQYTYHAGASTLDQYALAEYLRRGGLNRHLRRVRAEYAALTERMAQLVMQSFPAGTSVNRPAGGYLLWVTCPETLDALELYRRALEHGVAIAPGSLFSATGRYRNCFRLNAATVWDAELETALSVLADMAQTLT